MDDGSVSDIKRGRAARNAKLASIPVGFAGRAALGLGKRLTGKSKDEVTAELNEEGRPISCLPSSANSRGAR